MSRGRFFFSTKKSGGGRKKEGGGGGGGGRAVTMISNWPIIFRLESNIICRLTNES